jgi:Uma2 family endonuclease
MTTALLNPSPKTRKGTIPPVRWTVEEFHRINSAETWGRDRRLMLIDGQILEREPVNPRHASGVALVDAALAAAFPTDWYRRVQLPLVLGLDIDPMPDVALVIGSIRDYVDQHPRMAALVVEVANTSLDHDLTEKAELYATANIPEYWVMDLNSRTLIVMRDPVPVPENGNSYRSIVHLKPEESVQPLAKPEVTIKVADLLP